MIHQVAASISDSASCQITLILVVLFIVYSNRCACRSPDLGACNPDTETERHLNLNGYSHTVIRHFIKIRSEFLPNPDTAQTTNSGLNRKTDRQTTKT